MKAVRRFVLLIALSLVACGVDQAAHATARQATYQSWDEPVEVRDDRGVGLRFAAPPSRVISLVPAVTETLVALGGADHLVARTRFDRDERIRALPSVGGSVDPSLEIIVSLNPDLVVTWLEGSSLWLTDRLEALGIPVYAAEMGTVSDFRRNARNLGRLVGRDASADSLVSEVESELRGVAEKVRGGIRPSVLYVVWPDPLVTTGPGTFIDRLIAIAGGRTLFADVILPWPTVSFESVILRQPDLIVVTDEHGGRGSGTRWLSEAAGWRYLDAVKEGRVLLVEADLFNRPGPRMGQAARALAEALHPDRFGGLASLDALAAPEPGQAR